MISVLLYQFISVKFFVWPKGPLWIIRRRDSVHGSQVRPLYQAGTDLQALLMVNASKTAMDGSCMHSV